MKDRTFILFDCGHRWLVGSVAELGSDAQYAQASVEIAPDAGVTETAKALAAALRSAGYGGQGAGDGVMLGIASDRCFWAVIPLANPAGKKHRGSDVNYRRQSLLYRLEEQLPIAAEEVVGDFLSHDREVMGVCIQTSAVGPLVDSLEKAGIILERIAPTALLAAECHQEALRQADVFVAAHCEADCIEGECFEVFALADGKPMRWYTLADIHEVTTHLRALALHRTKPLELTCSGLDANQLKQFEGLADIASVKTLETHIESKAEDRDSIFEAAALAADRLARSGRRPWINLRRDALGPPDVLRALRRSLVAAVACVSFLLLSLLSIMLWRGYQYSAVTTHYEQQERQLFHSVLPRQSSDGPIRPRLASEERRLRALSGESPQGSGGLAQVHKPSSLLLLGQMLKSLPEQVRYRILEMRFDNDKVYLEGQVRSHADAELLAASLHEKGGFETDAPHTEQLPGSEGAGVSFAIDGRAVPDEDRNKPHP